MATTMSDDGDRSCPLCMEEMDPTDQQLKPCKCGYDICVWCWHQVMDMAEKESTEGRCPACRTAYDKDRIVGMAADCKRMVAAEKKIKPQKTKSKVVASSAAEDRKHLSSVRVVQRNLVYIMGLPSGLNDESVLERREYFGQYGKVLKVSMSRPGGTAPQQVANNNTCSVYITYSREDEAVRCIQSVHNFVLEGKPLRACFGTTKYCYTWLRNMPCSNPDCLYLHDVGSQEDSFTKDEIISAYTRSRVPQMASNILQPRAGNVLPPPADELSSNGISSAKHVLKSPSNNTSSQVKDSPNDTTRTKSTVLPAAASWGLRPSNSRPTASSMATSQSPMKQKTEGLNSSSNSSLVSANSKQAFAWHDDAVTTSKIPDGRYVVHTDHKSRPLESLKPGSGREFQAEVSDLSSETLLSAGHTSGSAWGDDSTASRIPEARQALHIDCSSSSTKPLRSTIDRNGLTSVSDASAEIMLNEARNSAWDDDTVTTSKLPDQWHSVHTDNRARPLATLESNSAVSRTFPPNISSKAGTDGNRTSGVSISRSSSSLAQEPVASSTNVGCSTSPDGLDCQSNSCLPDHLTRGSKAVSANVGNSDSCLGVDRFNLSQQHNSQADHQLVGMLGNLDLRSHQLYPEHEVNCKASVMPSAYVAGGLSGWGSELQKQPLSSSRNGMEGAIIASDDHTQRPSSNQSSCSSYGNYPLSNSNHITNNSQNHNVGDKQLSVDGNSRNMEAEVEKRFLSFRDDASVFLDGCKEEMPNNFVNSGSAFEKESKYSGFFDNVNNSTKASNVDLREKRIAKDIFSVDFDPWDDTWSSAYNLAKLIGQSDKQDVSSKLPSSWNSQNSSQSRFSFARQEYEANLEDSSSRDSSYAPKLVSSTRQSYGSNYGNTFPVNNFEGANDPVSSASVVLSDRAPGVTRAKISAPPGFSVPNRAPPPGFSSQENHLLGSPLQNQFQVHSSVNASDVEFIDPAILAVGKGRLPLGVNNPGIGLTSALSSQFNISENDPRLQLLMRQPISVNQDPRISNQIGDRFLQFNDGYISPGLSAQNSNNISPFAQMSYQQPSHILNNQWDGWNDVPVGNGMGVAEMLRSERLRNNYYPVNGEPKFNIPGSGDLYNRALGL